MPRVEWAKPVYDSEDPNDTGLRFTDVLFGFALREIVTRLVSWQALTDVARAHLLLGAVTILGSYIGFRKSQKRGKFELRFFNVATLRFFLDQLMVFSYFWLAIYFATDKVDKNGKLLLPSDSALCRFDARLITVIFLLYLAWDLLSHWMQHSGRYKLDGEPYTVPVFRTVITIICLLLAEGVLLVDSRYRPHGVATLRLLVALIAIMVVYRVAKDVLQVKVLVAAPTAPATSATASALAAAASATAAAASAMAAAESAAAAEASAAVNPATRGTPPGVV